MVSIVAVDAAGRRAFDRARVYPSPWLPDETAALVAVGVKAKVLPGPASEGSGLLRCARVSAVRVDCELVAGAGGERCATAAISLAHGQLRWGAYGCDAPVPRRPASRTLRRRDWPCDRGDRSCPPLLFGKLDEAALVPSS
jgi:hypothetical protein